MLGLCMTTMADDDKLVCPYCEGPPRKQHCKLVCADCGEVLRDCSDPFR